MLVRGPPVRRDQHDAARAQRPQRGQRGGSGGRHLPAGRLRERPSDPAVAVEPLGHRVGGVVEGDRIAFGVGEQPGRRRDLRHERRVRHGVGAGHAQPGRVRDDAIGRMGVEMRLRHAVRRRDDQSDAGADGDGSVAGHVASCRLVVVSVMPEIDPAPARNQPAAGGIAPTAAALPRSGSGGGRSHERTALHSNSLFNREKTGNFVQNQRAERPGRPIAGRYCDVCLANSLLNSLADVHPPRLRIAAFRLERICSDSAGVTH